MRRKLALLGIASLALAASVPTVNAQMMVDMSRFTCSQLLTGNPNAVEAAIWLSGYYNGLRKNTMLNLNQFKQNAELVVKECGKGPNNSVMQTVDRLLSNQK